MPKKKGPNGTATPPLPQFPKEAKLNKAPDYKAVYSNHTVFGLTALDFSITFGEVLEASPESISVEQRVRVTMSPQEAKVVAYLLFENINRYEAMFGKINDVPVQEQPPVKTPS